MGADVQAEHVELGPHPLGRAHLRQAARDGPLRGVAQVERELDVDRRRDRGRLRLSLGLDVHLRAVRTRVGKARGNDACSGTRATENAASARPDGAAPPVQLGDLQQQVTAGDLPTAPHRDGRAQPVEGVEPARHDKPLGDGPGAPRAVPEVRQPGVGPAGDDPGSLGRADALDLGQADPDAVAAPVGQPRVGRRLIEHADPLDPVGGVGGVDVEREDRDPELAGVVEDQPLGVHTGVVGEHPGQEGRRVVGLEPGRLVGRQCERRRMCLAEAERSERLEHLPHLLDHAKRVAPGQRGRHEPGLHFLLPRRACERAAHLVGRRERAASHDAHDLQHLLVEDHDPVGLRQHRLEIRVRVDRRLPPLPGLQERPDHVALDRAGPEQRDVDDEVLEGLRRERADQPALPGRLDLEAAERLGRLHEGEGCRVVAGNRIHLHVEAVDPGDLLHGVGHRRLHPDPEHVELEQPELLDVVLVELAHREAQPAGLHRGAVQQGAV